MMSKKERIELLEIVTNNLRATVDAYTKLASDLCVRVGEQERKIAALEEHVVQLLAIAAKAKAPIITEVPWDSGSEIIDEYRKRTAGDEPMLDAGDIGHAVPPPQIIDLSLGSWRPYQVSSDPLPHIRRSVSK